MRVVLDTNILARATPGKTGPAREVLNVVALPPHVFIFSPFLLSELSRVLRYERMLKVHGLSAEEIDEYIRYVQTASLMVEPPETTPPRVVPHDPDDNPVIATAIAGQTEVLCTRDRHFQNSAVQAYCAGHGIRILTDVELLHVFRELAVPPNGNLA